jgi:hypothetical protein
VPLQDQLPVQRKSVTVASSAVPLMWPVTLAQTVSPQSFWLVESIQY